MPIRIYVIPRPAREYMDAHASEWTMREWAVTLPNDASREEVYRRCVQHRMTYEAKE